MKEPAAREFAEKLIRERLLELVGSMQTAAALHNRRRRKAELGGSGMSTRYIKPVLVCRLRISSASSAISPSLTRRSTATSWSISIAPPPRKSRAQSSTLSCVITSATTPNIHRGVHTLSVRATEAHDEARETVRRFIQATSADEIIFVRSATEAVNLVAQTWGRANVGEGDEVLITAMEHHSNIVPWQMLCDEKRAHLCVASINNAGELELMPSKSFCRRARVSWP